MGKQGAESRIKVNELIALEEELYELKRQQGVKERPRLWMRLGDFLVAHEEKTRRTVSRKRYIQLALSCGWLCGSHRLYSGKYISGLLYLLLCWTGIPMAMTMIDLMIVLPIKADENGIIKI